MGLRQLLTPLPTLGGPSTPILPSLLLLLPAEKAESRWGLRAATGRADWGGGGLAEARTSTAVSGAELGQRGGRGPAGCCRRRVDAGSPRIQQDDRKERYVSVPGPSVLFGRGLSVQGCGSAHPCHRMRVPWTEGVVICVCVSLCFTMYV